MHGHVSLGVTHFLQIRCYNEFTKLNQLTILSPLLRRPLVVKPGTGNEKIKSSPSDYIPVYYRDKKTDNDSEPPRLFAPTLVSLYLNYLEREFKMPHSTLRIMDVFVEPNGSINFKMESGSFHHDPPPHNRINRNEGHILPENLTPLYFFGQVLRDLVDCDQDKKFVAALGQKYRTEVKPFLRRNRNPRSSSKSPTTRPKNDTSPTSAVPEESAAVASDNAVQALGGEKGSVPEDKPVEQGATLDHETTDVATTDANLEETTANLEPASPLVAAKVAPTEGSLGSEEDQKELEAWRAKFDSLKKDESYPGDVELMQPDEFPTPRDLPRYKSWKASLEKKLVTFPADEMIPEIEHYLKSGCIKKIELVDGYGDAAYRTLSFGPHSLEDKTQKEELENSASARKAAKQMLAHDLATKYADIRDEHGIKNLTTEHFSKILPIKVSLFLPVVHCRSRHTNRPSSNRTGGRDKALSVHSRSSGRERAEPG